MANDKRRSFVERLQDLLEAIKESLTPREPAPVPIPTREQQRYR